MKTMKVFPHFLVAGVLVIGTACSSANTGTSSGTETATGSATGTSSMGAASGTSATGASSSAMDAGSTGSVAGGTMGASGTTGTSSAGVGGTAASGAGGGTSAATEGTSGAGATGATGAAAATDMSAFMATFSTMQDPVFLLNAASSNMLEIQAGKLASQQASNAEVKKFAQMMVSHHTKATQELKAVATPLGVTMPETMMPVHQAMADRLKSKTGKDFDEAYMDLMETAHKMDIAMFEVKSKAADSPTVQAFATKTLPMLRSHHTMADNIEKKAD
ncbi:DUF4142 domain-containing protein [Hymenobacter sp. HD11105]